jgi:protein NRD1
MSSSVVGTFVSVLNEIKESKNGISGKRIKQLTQLAVDNVNEESALVDKISDYLQTTKDSHKLGALYIIDSIARTYNEHAKKLGETVSKDSNPGSFAHGLFKLSGVLTDGVKIAYDASAEDQRDKISKLLEIWKKINVFDAEHIDAIKQNVFGKQGSTTPSMPPPQLAQSSVPTSNDANDLLKKLASLGANPLAPSVPAPAPVQAPVQAPAPVQFQQPPPGLPNLSNLAGADPAAQQAALFQMLQQLQSSGQIPPLPQPPTIPQQQQQQQQQYQQQEQDQGQGQGVQKGGWSRGPQPVSQQDAFNSYRQADTNTNFRERPGGFSRRDRDRSPTRGGAGPRKDAPPPGHVVGEANVPGSPHYREKNISFDTSLPAGTIKVHSRTLFIGGVPNYMTETELASILRPYAEVQSVILNNERKHAFVKVYSRKEAEAVISSFNKNGQYNLRTRWGVGFGPRDCCDYQHGISIIPLARLTDADRRWVNEAQWGGIGMDKELVPGFVMEEPDIEIGEGVSSKAISQKMPTDGSRNGPRSTKPGEPDDIYTDPLNQATLPSFMQGNNNKSNVLSNLFGGNAGGPPQGVPGATQAAPPPPPAAAGAGSEQLSNLLSFLQQQQK